MVIIQGRPVDPVLKGWGANIASTRALRTPDGELRRSKRVPQMSQADLALALGVTQGTVSRWENGEVEPRRERKAQIASALGVDASSLFPLPRVAA